MFLFKYRCSLDPQGALAEDEEFAKIIGAYVNVYVNFIDFDGAVVLAEFYARRAGWIIEEHLEQFELSPREEDEDEDIELYKEAEEFGYTSASYMFSSDAEEDEE